MSYGLIGAGEIKIATYDETLTFGNRKFRDVLNCSKFSLTGEEESQEMPDYRSMAGGLYDEYKRVSKLSCSIELLELTSKNLALAWWGGETALAATPIVGESHKLYAGAFIPADQMIDTSVAPVVKQGATTILAADYTVSEGGVQLNATITTVGFVEGDAGTLDYTPLASTRIDALTGSQPVVSILFNGRNRNTGKSRIVRIWKAKVGIASGMENIGNSYIPLTLSVTPIKDESITGAGLSQYFQDDEPVTV